MKKILLILAILVTALFFAGCIVPSAPSINNVKVEVTRIEQDVSCGAKSGRVSNGEEFDYKCPPQCPPCDCDECDECDECPTCPTCPTPTCPSCPCYSVKWGNLFIDFQMTNIGNVDATVEGICFVITFEDKTTIKKCVDVGEILLIGEEKEKQVEISLSNPIQVIFVEPESIEFN